MAESETSSAQNERALRNEDEQLDEQLDAMEEEEGDGAHQAQEAQQTHDTEGL